MLKLSFVDARQVTTVATVKKDPAFVILPTLARMREPVSLRVVWRNATAPRVSYYYDYFYIIIMQIFFFRNFSYAHIDLFVYDFYYIDFFFDQSIPVSFYVKRFELSKETARYKN